jgi:hypothetical protein
MIKQTALLLYLIFLDCFMITRSTMGLLKQKYMMKTIQLLVFLFDSALFCRLLLSHGSICEYGKTLGYDKGDGGYMDPPSTRV